MARRALVSSVEEPDEELLSVADEFAHQIAETLDHTVASSTPVTARVRGSSVVVAAYNEHGDLATIPLHIRDEHRLDLRFEYWCRWDFTSPRSLLPIFRCMGRAAPSAICSLGSLSTNHRSCRNFICPWEVGAFVLVWKISSSLP